MCLERERVFDFLFIGVYIYIYILKTSLVISFDLKIWIHQCNFSRYKKRAKNNRTNRKLDIIFSNLNIGESCNPNNGLFCSYS
jgi:hypothetical protein